MATKYTTIMVPKHVAARLRAYARRMVRTAERGQLSDELASDNNQPGHQGVTLWRAVERLLEVQQQLDERRLRAAQKRREAKKAARRGENGGAEQ